MKTKEMKYQKIAIFVAVLIILMAGAILISKENKPIKVRLQTELGDVVIQLYDDVPLTTTNFRKLVNQGYYNGIAFHFVVKDFIVQTGDRTGMGKGNPGYTIKDEFTKDNHNYKGTVAMANIGPNTAGSQFFFNIQDNLFLDNTHVVFGKVTEGMDIIDRINLLITDDNYRPIGRVEIIKAKIV